MALPPCTIQWDTYTNIQWAELLNRCPHSTLLQSFYYAQTMREVHKQGVRHGIILIDGNEAGIIQAQDVGLFGKAIHGLMIDRGPCWFDGYGTLDHLQAVVAEINRQYPARFGRKRRFMPEFYQKSFDIPLENWKKSSKIKQYKTIIVDLLPELDEIRKKLRKNWRNHLNKSEKQGLTIKKDDNLSTLGHFLQSYLHDRLQKRYAGASTRFLATLAKYAAREGDCLLLNATEDDEIIASVLLFIHGRGATYQAGWTTPYGRDKCAHQLLLWEAIKILKNKGVTELDLGGYNDDTPSLKDFKDGMGGHHVALIGSYV